MSSSNNGHVSWSGLITTLLAVTGIGGGVGAWAIHRHEGTVHEGALSDGEFGQFTKGLERRLDRMERLLERIDQEVSTP